MIRLAMALACCCMLMAFSQPSATELPFEASKPVVEIEWRGQANMGQDEFLALIGIQVGDTVQREAIRRSLDRLYLKGFFSQIRIESAPVREGFKLTYYTTPAAFVQRYHLSGNRAVSDKAILERLRPHVGERFSEHRLEVSREALQQFYVGQGFPQARVGWRTQSSEDLTRVTIFLHVDEGPPLVIEDIRLEGVTAFAVEELLKKFRVQPGQPLNTERLSGDLERLQGRYHRAGYLTMRLEGPRIEPDPERQRAVVTITVVEGPKIDISFVGNRKLSSRVLRDAVLIDAFSGYSADVLADSARDLLERYREQGYHFATIRHHVEVGEGGRAVTIRFDIDEGPQVTVASLRLVGHRGLSESAIRAQLLTQPRRFLGFVTKGLFVEQQLERDLEAVRFLYRRRGFLRAEVTQDLTFHNDRSQVAIQVVIDEGPRTFVQAVALEGAQRIPESELRSQLTLQAGDPFDAERLQEDVDRLAALYERRGYRQARLTVERRLTDGERFIHLTYRIDEGQPTVVGDIIVQGNFRTQAEVIARELTFQPGDPLSLTKLLESRRRLSRLTLFSRIAMDPRFEDVADEQDVVIQVVERKPMALNLGAGYGSEDKLRGFVEFAHHNIDGMHRQFRARAQASFREQKYLVHFREPRLLGTPVSSTVGLSRAEERRQSFDVRRTSAQLGFEYPFAEHYRAFVTYSFDLERLFDVDRDAVISEGDRGRLNIASVLAMFQRDTRDNIVDARSGALQRLSVEVADLVLGSEVDFVKLIGTTQWFVPLFWETVGAVSLQGGLAEAFGATGEVPISRRFFLGGSNTVRGYDFERLGPSGPDGAPTGGDVFVLANLEWRVPLYKGFGLVVFSDIGNVYRAIDALSPGGVKGSLGLGLRYRTPIGPIRLDYGRKLAPERNETSGRFHFSVGQAF
jgi:outer membrane protein insertion porin family